MESDHPTTYQRVDALAWTAEEECTGKRVHLRDCPKGHHVNVFRLQPTTPRSEPDVDFIVTNDRTPLTTQVVHAATDLRWKMEEIPRYTKQFDRD